MSNPITAQLRDPRWNSLGFYEKTAKAAADHIDAQAKMIKALTEALDDALAWVDAVPSGTPLPVMPGFDRDALNDVLAAAKETT